LPRLAILQSSGGIFGSCWVAWVVVFGSPQGSRYLLLGGVLSVGLFVPRFGAGIAIVSGEFVVWGRLCLRWSGCWIVVLLLLGVLFRVRSGCVWQSFVLVMLFLSWCVWGAIVSWLSCGWCGVGLGVNGWVRQVNPHCLQRSAFPFVELITPC